MDKKEKLKAQVLLIIVNLFFIFAILKMSLLKTDDGTLHFIRVMGSAQSIENTGDLPIIIEKFCNGWGYAPNLFYNPMSTYIPILISFISHSYTLAIKLYFCLMVFLASEFMYQFTKNITKKDTIAILAAVLYITNPYYLSNIFVRGAIGEISALTFLPLLFLGLYDLFERDGKKQYYIIIGTVGIALSHNITLLYAAIFSVVYMLISINKIKEKPKQIIKYCILDLLFILTMTSFYIVPMLLNKINAEYTIFHNQYMSTSNEFVSENTIRFFQLFVNDNNYEIIFKIGIPIIIGIIFLFIFRKYLDIQYKRFVTIFLCFSSICIFMTTEYFPWKYVPETLCMLQFPWRMLGFSDFFLSFCAAIGIHIVLEKKLKIKIEIIRSVIPTVSCIILIYAFCFSGIKILKDTQQEKMTEQYYIEAEQLTCMQINREYLPLRAYVKLNSYLQDRAKEAVVVLQGDAEIKQIKKEGLKVEIEIENIKNDTIIEFPFLYYLGYEAIAINESGEKTKIDVMESENGFVALRLMDTNMKQIEVEYKTPIEYKIAYIISIISWLVFITIFVKDYLKRKEKNK